MYLKNIMPFYSLIGFKGGYPCQYDLTFNFTIKICLIVKLKGQSPFFTASVSQSDSDKSNILIVIVIPILIHLLLQAFFYAALVIHDYSW